MVLNFYKKYIVAFVCLLLAVFLLSKMLLPGYILTLDMVWLPALPYGWRVDELNNSFLIHAFLHALSLLISAWVVQKMLLVALFFLLFYIPWKFLPFVAGTWARVFAAGVFALNPFVYSRILAGQWFHLFGYALLPLLLYSLVRLTDRSDRRSAGIFFLALFCIGLFSIHFLYLACVVSGIWLFSHVVHVWWKGSAGQAKSIAQSAFLAGLGFVLINLYWIIPALVRPAPLEARFDQTYFTAFAAGANDTVPVLANVAVLGGFWGEHMAWRYYFVWPQEQMVFWVAAISILALVGLGVWRLLRKPETRFSAAILCVIGIGAYVTALGAADTPFQHFNLFLYEHVPFWSGLRDSHKIAGVLAVVYAVFAGVGVSAFLEKIKARSVSMESFSSVAILLLPAIFGMYMWGGMHGQLAPVWYPQGWYEAKGTIDQLPPGEKVLVLPWHGYLSLDFARNRIVANPATAFFGRDRVVAGRGVEFGSIHDQEIDPKYRDIDRFVLSAETLTPQQLASGLKERGISHILIIENSAIPRSEEGLTKWRQFSMEVGDPLDTKNVKTWANLLSGEIDTVIISPSVVLWKLAK